MMAANSAVDFRHLVGGFASGVTIVTTRGADGTPHGFTATSFSSVSLEPPLVLVCLDVKADCHLAFGEAEAMAINILGAGQRDVAMRFASRGSDKFAGIATEIGAHTGVPLIEGAIVQIECRMHTRTRAGDHTVLIGEVLAGRRVDHPPLLYHARAFGTFKAE